VHEAHAIELIWEHKNLQMGSTQDNLHFRRSSHPYKKTKRRGEKGGQRELEIV
jgi:hypothetical protein